LTGTPWPNNFFPPQYGTLLQAANSIEIPFTSHVPNQLIHS